MLKPWVVEALVWTYHAGLLLGLVGVVWVWWDGAWHFRPWAERRGALATILVGCGCLLAGWPFELGVLSMLFGVLCVVMYGWLLLVNPRRWFSRLLIIPLPLLPLAGYVMFMLHGWPKIQPFQHENEQRLAAGLMCRTYPLFYDSVTGPRLMLLRESRILRRGVGSVGRRAGFDEMRLQVVPRWNGADIDPGLCGEGGAGEAGGDPAVSRRFRRRCRCC